MKLENKNPFYKSRLAETVQIDVRLVGKLPPYDIEMNEDQDRWMISKTDKDGVTKQLISG